MDHRVAPVSVVPNSEAVARWMASSVLRLDGSIDAAIVSTFPSIRTKSIRDSTSRTRRDAQDSGSRTTSLTIADESR